MIQKKDILEIKPGIYGVSLNLRELWRRFISRPKEDPVTIVANRFIRVFKEHGVAISQIPRLVQGVTLEQLRDPELLLPALTPNILEKVAELFQIKLSWLEGTTNIIYDVHPSYKNPWAFFEDARNLKIDQFGFPLVVFCSAKKLDYKSDKDQALLLVLREPCAQLGDKTIFRYRIHDQFLWGYWKSRIQLKAMMRIWYKKIEAPVPIYLVSPNILSDLEECKLIPHTYYQNSRRMKGCFLEDFSLLPEESAKSKDLEEMPTVLRYIDVFKLDQIDSGAKNPRGSRDTQDFY